ncbi:MAG TPA: hypothetical protein VED63_05350, partial [Acidimicrobiales bacterium]|nr:hypothetical protein [Acidimicrobiales bacterium]
ELSPIAKFITRRDAPTARGDVDVVSSQPFAAAVCLSEPTGSGGSAGQRGAPARSLSLNASSLLTNFGTFSVSMIGGVGETHAAHG